MSELEVRFTLVLGAGASKSFGLPLGGELRTKLAKDLNIRFDDFGTTLSSGSPEIVDALRILVRESGSLKNDINPHRHAAVQIAENMPLASSIDEYIERHRGNELKADCAKLGIAKAILEAERSSTIFSGRNSYQENPLSKATDSWISTFLRDVTRGLTRDEVPEALARLSVINFNYDRCFEYFAFHWLRRVYEFDDRLAWAIVEKIPIWHPYGTLGPLDYGVANDSVPFGAEARAHRLVSIMRRIRTYSEALENEEALHDSLVRLSHSNSVVFLGFGFHKQNMDLLDISQITKKRTFKCHATSHSIPEPTWQIFEQRISKALGVARGNLFLSTSPHKCEEFWQEYGEEIIS